MYLPEFITHMSRVLNDEQLITPASEGMQGGVVQYVPVEILLKTTDGIPVSSLVTAVGVRTDAAGNPVALVLTTLEEGAFNAADKAA